MTTTGFSVELEDKSKKSSNKTLPKHIVHDGVKWLIVFSKIMLDHVSGWPDNQNNKTRTVHILSLGCEFFIIYGHFYCLFEKDSNLVASADAFIYLVICLESISRRIILHLNSKQLSKILTKLYFVFWPCKKSGSKLNKELTAKSNYVFCYCVVCISAASMCIIQFIILSFNERTLPLKTKYPFSWQESPYYELLYVFQAFVCLQVVFGVCSADMFFVCIVWNCIAQFKLLQEHLRSNFEKTVYEQKEGYKTKGKQMMRLFIEQHDELIRTCQEIDSIFSSFLLIQCLASMFMVCLSGFIMTAKPERMRLTVPYLFAHIGELFIFGLLGEYLIDESSEISNAAFECGWHLSSQDTDFPKALTMIMIRAQRPIQLSTGGFGYLTLAAFINLVKLAFSLYTLLKNMFLVQDLD